MSGSDSKTGVAFVKGGAGCLLAFLGVGLIFLALGGEVYLNAGGVILLLVIGGIIGVIVNAIYQRGRRDAVNDDPNPRGPIDPD